MKKMRKIWGKSEESYENKWGKIWKQIKKTWGKVRKVRGKMRKTMKTEEKMRKREENEESYVIDFRNV